MHFKLQFPNPVIYFILMFKVNNNNNNNNTSKMLRKPQKFEKWSEQPVNGLKVTIYAISKEQVVF